MVAKNKPHFHFPSLHVLFFSNFLPASMPDVPLVTPEGSLPVDSSPHKSQRTYHPILEGLEDMDVASVDSYTMAMEGEGR